MLTIMMMIVQGETEDPDIAADDDDRSDCETVARRMEEQEG